jgi:UDP-N-acetylglucosamine 2-epimerase
MRKLLVVVGVRPQYLKAAALVHELSKAAPHIVPHVVDIRQHYDERLNSAIVADVGLRVDTTSDVEHGRGPLHYVARGLETLECLAEEMSHEDFAVVVFGDANPALVGMIAAQKLRWPLIHVEAGARRDPREQEHWNSLLVDAAADLRLAVTPRHLKELERESPPGETFLTGDMAWRWYSETVLKRSRASSLPREGVLITLHRPENMSRETLDRCLQGCLEADVPVTFVSHPRNSRFLEESDWGARIRIVPPLAPTQVLSLVSRSAAVLTDSGGLAREAHYLGTPVLMRRDVGGWPELREFGVLKPVADDTQAVRSGLEWAMDLALHYPPGSPLVVSGGIELGIEKIRRIFDR